MGRSMCVLGLAVRRECSYLSGDLDNPATYQRLAKLLNEIDRTSGTNGNYLFYFAIPATAFEGVVETARRGGAGA